MPKLSAWSFSRLEYYKNCPYAAKLKYIDKHTEADRPPPPRGKEHANERGSRVHDFAEKFILGEEEMIHELKHFKQQLQDAKDLREEDQSRVSPEEMWLFDSEWGELPADASYEDIWIRIIADLQIWSEDRKTLKLIDFKTGKRYRNEVKHGRQLQLYQLSAFMKFPELEVVEAELWYLDHNLTIPQKFTREQGLKFFKMFNDQANYMCNDDEFKPTPSHQRCMFCAYGPKDHSNKWVTKTGDCEYGVENIR